MMFQRDERTSALGATRAFTGRLLLRLPPFRGVDSNEPLGAASLLSSDVRLCKNPAQLNGHRWALIGGRRDSNESASRPKATSIPEIAVSA